MVNFKIATIDDFSRFNDIYANTCYIGEKDLIIRLMSYRAFKKLVENEKLILVFHDLILVGYAIVEIYDDGEMQIKNMYVLKVFQKQGIGRKMIEYIENYANSFNIGIKYLFIIPQNEELNLVLEKLGFIKVFDKYMKEIGK